MRREDGQILPGLMVLLIAILGLSTLVFQVGRAAIMRSDAQTAADAAALAAARNIRAQLMTQLATRGYSDLSLVVDASVEAAARDYAERNGGRLARPVQRVGADVKVWVTTEEDLGEDAEPLDAERRRGEARARARLSLSVAAGISTGAFGGGGFGGGADASIPEEDWDELAKELDKPPKCSNNAQDNDIVKLGRFLLEHNIVADENKQLGGDPALPGEHSANGWHYACDDSGAIDINADNAAGGEKAALDAIAGPIARLGFYVIWQSEDHFDHMHVQPSGGAPGFGGASFGGYGAAGSLEDTQIEIKLVDWEAPMALLGPLGSGGGTPFGPPDPDVAKIACQVLDRLDASPKARLALWEALIVESGVKNLTYGHSSSVGVLQLLDIHGSFERRRDVPWVIREFLVNGFTGRGGAITVARRNPGLSAGLVAQAVQGSARPFAYDQRRGQAIALNEKFCGGKGL